VMSQKCLFFEYTERGYHGLTTNLTPQLPQKQSLRLTNAPWLPSGLPMAGR
jgi:hypothetical protein